MLGARGTWSGGVEGLTWWRRPLRGAHPGGLSGFCNQHAIGAHPGALGSRPDRYGWPVSAASLPITSNVL